MRRTDRELTDGEIINALENIIDIIIKNSEGEVLPQFKKESRAAQIGFLIQRSLLEAEIIEPGKPNYQRRLKM